MTILNLRIGQLMKKIKVIGNNLNKDYSLKMNNLFNNILVIL